MSDPRVEVTEEATLLNVTETSTFLEIVEDAATLELRGAEDLTMVVEERPTHLDLDTAGPQGAAGPPGVDGADGQSGVEVFIAGAALSGHRAITVDIDGTAIYADNGTTGHATSPLGVSTAAAVQGDPIEVSIAGLIAEGSWNWTPQRPVFVGAAGALTQTPPSAPRFARIVGWATTPTTLFVDPQPSIILA